jgi:mono/diheme cytochrome c family protein
MKTIIVILIVLFKINLSASVENGKKLYLSNCAICHTVNGGNAFGKDFNIVSYTRKKEDIKAYTRNPYENFKRFGYSANAMPTLPLKDKEIDDIADYIDSLQVFKIWMKK